MDKKHLVDKIINALRISLNADHTDFPINCGTYDWEDFDSYWEGMLPIGKLREIESHCLGCPFCIKAMETAWDIHEKTTRILKKIERYCLNN